MSHLFSPSYTLFPIPSSPTSLFPSLKMMRPFNQTMKTGYFLASEYPDLKFWYYLAKFSINSPELQVFMACWFVLTLPLFMLLAHTAFLFSLPELPTWAKSMMSLMCNTFVLVAISLSEFMDLMTKSPNILKKWPELQIVLDLNEAWFSRLEIMFELMGYDTAEPGLSLLYILLSISAVVTATTLVALL